MSYIIWCHVYETSRMSKFCQRQKIENRLLRAGENGNYLLLGWFLLLRLQFSCPVLSNSLWPHELQHARHPCPSPTPGVQSMSIEWVMPSTHLILCRLFLLLPSIFPSVRVFSNESALHIRWPKYWSFILNISPSNEHPGIVYFRMDLLDLLAVQGTLKSLLQHHSSKASIPQHSAFLIV